MTSLPIFKSDIQELMLMQTKWASALNPVLGNPLTNASVLKSVSLSTGSNTINTLLGRKLQGWFIVRQRAAASIHDDQDNNDKPELTLVLVSSAPVVVDLAVY